MTSTKDKDIIRGEVYWVNLDPTIGSEIQKTRPAVIISNNIQNKVSARVIVIPLTSNTSTIFPFEAKVKVQDKTAKAITDQIRTIDKSRLGDCLGKITKLEMSDIEAAIKITLSLE
jgi:mRNA interferase MazF